MLTEVSLRLTIATLVINLIICPTTAKPHRATYLNVGGGDYKVYRDEDQDYDMVRNDQSKSKLREEVKVPLKDLLSDLYTTQDNGNVEWPIIVGQPVGRAEKDAYLRYVIFERKHKILNQIRDKLVTSKPYNVIW